MTSAVVARTRFGWPLALTSLALKNIGGVDYTPGGDDPAEGFALPVAPGIPAARLDPVAR